MSAPSIPQRLATADAIVDVVATMTAALAAVDALACALPDRPPVPVYPARDTTDGRVISFAAGALSLPYGTITWNLGAGGPMGTVTRTGQVTPDRRAPATEHDIAVVRDAAATAATAGFFDDVDAWRSALLAHRPVTDLRRKLTESMGSLQRAHTGALRSAAHTLGDPHLIAVAEQTISTGHTGSATDLVRAVHAAGTT